MLLRATRIAGTTVAMMLPPTTALTTAMAAVQREGEARCEARRGDGAEHADHDGAAGGHAEDGPAGGEDRGLGEDEALRPAAIEPDGAQHAQLARSLADVDEEGVDHRDHRDHQRDDRHREQQPERVLERALRRCRGCRRR